MRLSERQNKDALQQWQQQQPCESQRRNLAIPNSKAMQNSKTPRAGTRPDILQSQTPCLNTKLFRSHLHPQSQSQHLIDLSRVASSAHFAMSSQLHHLEPARSQYHGQREKEGRQELTMSTSAHHHQAQAPRSTSKASQTPGFSTELDSGGGAESSNGRNRLSICATCLPPMTNLTA
ncbi:uncharacterized protein MYCGRDRAFT_106416, partial [Zymoseptoria tritici IPO323]